MPHSQLVVNQAGFAFPHDRPPRMEDWSILDWCFFKVPILLDFHTSPLCDRRTIRSLSLKSKQNMKNLGRFGDGPKSDCRQNHKLGQEARNKASTRIGEAFVEAQGINPKPLNPKPLNRNPTSLFH